MPPERLAERRALRAVETPSSVAAGRLGAEQLLDEEASGGVQPVPVAPLGDGQNLVGPLEPELGCQQTHVILVLADAMGEDLQRQQGLRRCSEATEARQIEDGRRGRIIALQKALDRIVEPAGRQPELLSDTAAAS